MTKKLVIVSMDAMIFEDLEYASQFPAYRELLEKGALVRHLRSIYPTLTYPCHVAMISGCYPDRSGVWNNYVQAPGVSPTPWNFYHDAVRCEDLMDAAHRAGYTTASVSWPVSGSHKSVDWLVDEIWAYSQNPEDFRRAYLDSGTSEALYEELVAPWMPLRMKREQPGTGWFSTRVASGIIRKHAPDVLALHLAPVDTFRHSAGVFSDLAKQGVAVSAEMLQELLDAVRDSGFYDETNFIVTSDHGQIDVDRVVSPNVLLKEAGMIRLKKDGSLEDWDAWCFAAGASAQIRVRDPANLEDVRELFASRLGSDCGYSAVYSRRETEDAEHLSGDFDFVLETDGRSSFSESATGPYFTEKHGGHHGHHPDTGPSPFLLACGPDFRRGAVLENARLVDPPVTYAKILGLSLPEAQGRVLTELLNE